MSPKRGPLHVPRAPHTDNPPPVVAIAPTPTHQRSRESAPITSSAADLKGSLPSEVSSHLTAAAGGDLPRAPAGFQPYRADEQQRLLEALYPGYASSAAAAAAAAAAGGLYSPAPTRPGYPPAPRRPEERYLESLYPLQHPLQHSLYGLEEQLYLERLGLLRPPLGVSGLSPYSPLLTAGRYPAPSELLHSPLYMSQSLYLQERLKLEEDTRRKLETERERSEREQRTERDRSEREQRAERSREPTSHAVAPSARERSPVRPVDTGATGSLKAEPRTSGARESRSPGERRSASSGGEQQTSPAAYRPYLPSPVPRPAPREPPLDLRTGAEPAPAAPAVTNATAAPPLAKPRSHKKTTVVRPFEDTVSTPAEPAAPVPTPAAPAPVAEAPLNLSERSRPAERAEPPPAAAAPAEQLTSTLDQREELRRRGLKTEEPEPVRHLDLLTGPPCETVTSPEKLQFLAHVGLTTHSFKNDVELKKCERRAALHLPLSAATSPEGAAEPEKEPEPEPRPSSQLTAALNEAADMPAKLLFLERLGLRPVAAGDTAPAAAAGMAVQAAGASGAGSSGGSPSTAGSSSSGAGSPSQRKSDNSSRRDSAPAEEKGRRNRSSPSSRSSRSSRQSPQAAQTAPGAARQPASSPPAPPPAPEAAPRLALPGAAWPGMQAVTQMYTAYNKERAAATEQGASHPGAAARAAGSPGGDLPRPGAAAEPSRWRSAVCSGASARPSRSSWTGSEPWCARCPLAPGGNTSRRALPPF
ncbi:hypothetical protein FJT64_027887 [Amphibalanus amphitrite]|uniref:Genetic suppressor element-like domain-containing protein n=1 Tax=Amphibalanus amphitrite TaxID=1232801 RepID=A0A6A4VTA8_AMPAM|nr:hypothetical protein FJT64_027887 [Amphibalanus amphitrite]